MQEAFDIRGYRIVPGVLDRAMVDSLVAAIEPVCQEERRRAGGDTAGVRDLIGRVPAVRALACSSAVRSLVESVLGAGCSAVRGILFDKTPEANWKVIWHQDVTIAVRRREEQEGFGCWSQKAGIWHVQPPAAVLEAMLIVRLHLDECGEANGPLRVIPGSHRVGHLNAAELLQWRQNHQEIECPAPRGGALLMRPLLLHASSAAREPRRRRVVHLEFASAPLPLPLEWHTCIEPMELMRDRSDWE